MKASLQAAGKEGKGPKLFWDGLPQLLGTIKHLAGGDSGKQWAGCPSHPRGNRSALSIDYGCLGFRHWLNLVRNLEGGAFEKWDQDGLGSWCVSEYLDFSVWRITSC